MSRFISVICLLLPLGASGADLEFTGGLERVAPESIVIRLADGTRINAPLPKAGPLSAETITAQYKLADEVHITCKPMGPDHCLALKSLQYLRPPTPKERALVLGTPASPAQPELERVRQVNLERAASMPNSVADETAKRYTSSAKANPPEWKLNDTVESDITFKGNEPTREHIRINGKPWNKPTIPGVNWSVEFAPKSSRCSIRSVPPRLPSKAASKRPASSSSRTSSPLHRMDALAPPTGIASTTLLP